MRGSHAMLAAALLLLPRSVPAQVARLGESVAGPPRAQAGGELFLAQPVGEFDDYIDMGFGFGGHLLLRLDPAGVLGLRLDGGFVTYGRETRAVCLSPTVGCRILVDLTTSNNIVFGTVGPQLVVPAGPVRPYVNGGAGFSYFATTSSLRGASDNHDFANTTNFDDGTFAWSAGGGLYIPLSIGSTTLAIDLGARYLANGEVEYLREGDIEDHPDGSITLHPRRSEANLVVWQIGVSFGLGGGR